MINKSELKKQYKQTLTPMGIFQVSNTINGKVLIGKSKNLPGSLNKHSFTLKMNSHTLPGLQEEYNTYGESAFVFEVLDRLEPKEDPAYNYDEDLETLENLWLEKLQPYDEKGYNKRKIRR